MLAGAGWAAVGNMNGQLDPEAEQVRAKLDTEPGMETQPGNQVEYPGRCSKDIRIVHVFMFMPNIAYFIDATVVFQKLGGDGGYVVYTRRWLVLAMFVLYSASNAFQWTQLVTSILVIMVLVMMVIIAMSGDHHVHPGEVLQHLHPGRLLDQHDLHGSLHPTHLPSIMAPRQKGENPRFPD